MKMNLSENDCEREREREKMRIWERMRQIIRIKKLEN